MVSFKFGAFRFGRYHATLKRQTAARGHITGGTPACRVRRCRVLHFTQHLRVGTNCLSFSLDTNAWEFFEYSEAEDAWRGPCTWDVDRAELGVACMAWTLMPDGSDVFWKVEPPHRTFRLAGGAIEQIKKDVEVVLPLFDTKTGRLARRGRLTTVADLISQEQFGWARALVREERQDQEVPDCTSASVSGALIFSLQHHTLDGRLCGTLGASMEDGSAE